MPRENTTTVEPPNYDLVNGDVHIGQKNELLIGISVQIPHLEVRIDSKKYWLMSRIVGNT